MSNSVKVELEADGKYAVTVSIRATQEEAMSLAYFLEGVVAPGWWLPGVSGQAQIGRRGRRVRVRLRLSVWGGQ